MNTTNAICLQSHFTNKLIVDGDIGWFIRSCNPSTGYNWQCVPDNSGVYEVVEQINLQPSTAQIVTGVPGKIIWKVMGIKQGSGRILFQLFPPGVDQPCETISLEIKVESKP